MTTWNDNTYKSVGWKINEDDVKVFSCKGCRQEFPTAKSAGNHARKCPKWNPYTISEETRKKLSDNARKQMTGTKLSTEHKRNIGLSLKGQEAWNKGIPHSKETIAKMSKSHMRENLSKETLELYSKNRAKRNREREITPELRKAMSNGIKNSFLKGRKISFNSSKNSYYSYFRKQILRSSFEAIYAIWLELNNIKYDYEKIRVKYEGKVYISDFFHSDTVIEIKPVKDKCHESIQKAFENAGYKFKFVYKSDINIIKKKLKEMFNIDTEKFYNDLGKFCHNKNKGNSSEFLKWDIVNNKIVYLNEEVAV